MGNKKKKIYRGFQIQSLENNRGATVYYRLSVPAQVLVFLLPLSVFIIIIIIFVQEKIKSQMEADKLKQAFRIYTEYRYFIALA